MALQVFIQNPDSSEPWAFCGPAQGNWQELVKSLGHFLQAEVENAAVNGESEFNVSINLVEMTDDEVAALPEI